MDGVRWLLRNCIVGLSSGGILGDEMGLGKTIQAAIAVLCCDENYPSLIVTPKSLVLNWKVEIQKFIPDGFANIIMFISSNKCVIYRFNPTSSTHGSVIESIKSTANSKTLIITSYPILRNEFNKSNSLLSLHFSCCVLDEGHFIRNHTSQLHRAVCSVQANHRIVLCGTPIQNCMEDIYAIFQFIAPGYFENYDRFYDYYIKPIAQAYRKKNRANIASANERIEALNQAVRPFLLRRTKDEVHLELPQKMMCDVMCPLTECQESV